MSKLTETPAPETIKMIVSRPAGKEPRFITKEFVWGKYDEKLGKKVHDGLIVAHYDKNKDTICPASGTLLDYKDVTFKCEPHHFDDVIYWLEYVQGADCITCTREDSTHIYIRTEYTCW